MDNISWIVVGGLLMSAIALTGGVTSLLPVATLDRLLLPLVALAAGTLLGGAFFHMIPEGLSKQDSLTAPLWILAGFTTFLALEQFLHWHESHHAEIGARRPVTYLILIGDAIDNFLGGLGIASTYLVNPSAGIVAWIAAVAHEIPQELGDFGILVHGGFPRRRALLWNLGSALTFPIGALLAYFSAQWFDVSGMILFGAGNFIYIAASDLIPEIKAQQNPVTAISHLGFMVLGIGLTFIIRL